MRPRAKILLALSVLGGLALMVASPVIYARTVDARANEERLRPTIAAAERAHGLPRGLLHRLLYQESRFRSDIIEGSLLSAAGAAGVAQFMPATAARFGIDPLVPAQAIDGAARYLKWLYGRFGSWRLALAGYNAGEGAVQKFGDVPPYPETQNYVAAILADVQVA